MQARQQVPIKHKYEEVGYGHVQRCERARSTKSLDSPTAAARWYQPKDCVS